MLRFEDSAEEVDLKERLYKAAPTRGKKKSVKSRSAGTLPIALRPQDPLGVDAKNYNDEIPDPDLVIPE